MFDAGAIEARLTIRTSDADRQLRQFEDKVNAATRRRHEIKIAAVFDTASMTNARRVFQRLDDQISRDAMNRLRTSPQGSVLGALNALFSPHPVTGAPSASQAAKQGLLGKMISGQGGGIGQTRTEQQNTIKNVIGVDDMAAKAAGARAGREAADAANDAATREARSRGGFLGTLLGGFKGGGGGGGRDTGGEGGASGAGFLGGIARGIGPGILGLSAKTAGVLGLGGAALGALPGLLPVAAALGIGGAGLGFLALGAKTLIGTKNVAGKAPTQGPLFEQAQNVKTALQTTLQGSASALLGPLGAAFAQIPGLLKGIAPALKTAFGAAGTLVQPLLLSLDDLLKDVLPGLSAAFRAVAPLLRPLLDGLGLFIKNLLPGIISLLKVAMPAIRVFAQILGTLGKDLGSLFASAIPVIKAASLVMKDIFDVLGSLFPIIGKLAAVFASALAPVFTTFSKIVQSLLPFLVIVGKVIASLAGAVLGDLVAALGAVGQLLQAVAPAFALLATAVSQVFTVLENTGVFAILGDALEGLVKPLAVLINALVRGLVPILQPVIMFIGQLSSLLVTQLVKAVILLLPPLTYLATQVLAAIAQVLPVVLPLLLSFTRIFSDALVGVIAGVASALTAVLSAIPPQLLRDIVVGVLAIVGAMKAWAIIQGILDVLFSLNPLGIIVVAIVAIGTAIALLVTHWSQIWGEIKRIADDAWHFIWNGFGKFLLPLLGPAGLIALGVIELYQHWSTIWGAIKGVAKDFYTWIWTDFGAKIDTFFTKTVPGWIGSLPGAISAIFKNAYNWLLQAGKDIITGLWDGLKAVWNGANGVAGWFGAIPGHLLSWAKDAITWLLQAGLDVINGFWDGMKVVWDKVTGWIGGLAGWIKTHKGPISLDRALLVANGKALMEGLHLGLTAGFAAGPMGFIAGLATTIGEMLGTKIGTAGLAYLKKLGAAFGKNSSAFLSGFAVNWIQQALQMAGFPMSWANPLSVLVSKESGGNPNAQNPTSVMGEHATGMWQMLPSTFLQYAGGMPLSDIWNPVLEGVAALRYIAATYGSPYNIPGLLSGNYQGYGKGGPINEPIIGWGVNTGTTYTFGERGREWVVPESGGGAGMAYQLAGTINLMLPEGTSIAKAFSELAWQLQVARMTNLLPGASHG